MSKFLKRKVHTVFLMLGNNCNMNCKYCLWFILMRGYKHPVLSLTANNKFINPSQAFAEGMLAARNSCNALSPNAKKTLSKLLGLNIV